MRRRMTIVFDDEELYTQLKVEAARSHRPAKDLVAEALNSYFDAASRGPGAPNRSEAKRNAMPGAAAVDAILQQLGLTKEAAGTPAR